MFEIPVLDVEDVCSWQCDISPEAILARRDDINRVVIDVGSNVGGVGSCADCQHPERGIEDDSGCWIEHFQFGCFASFVRVEVADVVVRVRSDICADLGHPLRPDDMIGRQRSASRDIGKIATLHVGGDIIVGVSAHDHRPTGMT